MTKQENILPAGWEMKKLGDVCEIFNGSTPLKRKNEYWDKGNINWFTISDIRKQGRFINFTDQKITKEGFNSTSISLLPINTVLLCCTASVGEYAITNVQLTTNQQFNGLVVKDDSELTPMYLFYFVSTLKKQLLGISGKTTIDFISMTKIKNLQIPLPPLSEQKSIVQFLDSMFENIDAAKKSAEENLVKAKQVFESYLERVFEEEGEDWEEKELGDLGKPKMCKRIFKDETLSSGDIPFYKIGTFGKTANAFISNKIYNEYRKKFSFPKVGDILLSASGTIGRRVVYNGEPAYFQDSNIVWIDNNEEYVSNKYLYLFYGYCDWNPSKGATISRLYNSDLKRIKISFPKSLGRQKEIVGVLDELGGEAERLEEVYREKCAKFDELKKSVLQEAFNGKL